MQVIFPVLAKALIQLEQIKKLSFLLTQVETVKDKKGKNMNYYRNV